MLSNGAAAVVSDGPAQTAMATRLPMFVVWPLGLRRLRGTAGSPARADEAGVQQVIDEATVSKAFGVIAIRNNYNAALRTGRRASELLEISLDLRSLHVDKPTGGLSLPRADCIAAEDCNAL